MKAVPSDGNGVGCTVGGGVGCTVGSGVRDGVGCVVGVRTGVGSTVVIEGLRVLKVCGRAPGS